MGDMHPKLRLIRGGAGNECRVAGIRIVLAPTHKPPFPVEALVAEEDTFLVLSAQTDLTTRNEHPMRVWTAAHDAEPAPPGTVVVQNGYPLKLLAVVHDLDSEPTWNEEWVSKALAEVLRQADRLRLRSLGLPLLGTVHGRLSDERSLQLLWSVLDAGIPVTLERLWLLAPEGLENAEFSLQERPT